MKKFFVITIVLLLSLVGTAICSCSQDVSGAISTINTLVKQPSNNVTVVINQTIGQDSLTSRIELHKQIDGSCTLTYTLQEFSTFDLSTGIIPQEFVTVTTGSITVKDNVITACSQDGLVGKNVNDCGIDYVSDVLAGFSFRGIYFENATATANKFSADVKSGMEKSFTNNSNFSGSQMSISVSYFSGQLSSIKLNYTATNSAKVEIQYLFN